MDNTCYFGPDIKGQIVKEVLSSERADGCDRLFCVCDTHDFEAPETFESVLASRMAMACDRTKKRGGGPCEPVIIEFPDIFGPTTEETGSTGETDGNLVDPNEPGLNPE